MGLESLTWRPGCNFAYVDWKVREAIPPHTPANFVLKVPKSGFVVWEKLGGITIGNIHLK